PLLAGEVRDGRAALWRERQVAVRAAQDDDGEPGRAAVGRALEPPPDVGRVHDHDLLPTGEQLLGQDRRRHGLAAAADADHRGRLRDELDRELERVAGGRPADPERLRLRGQSLPRPGAHRPASRPESWVTGWVTRPVPSGVPERPRPPDPVGVGIQAPRTVPPRSVLERTGTRRTRNAAGASPWGFES